MEKEKSEEMMLTLKSGKVFEIVHVSGQHDDDLQAELTNWRGEEPTEAELEEVMQMHYDKVYQFWYEAQIGAAENLEYDRWRDEK